MTSLIRRTSILVCSLTLIFGCDDAANSSDLPERMDSSTNDIDGGTGPNDGTTVTACLRDTDCNSDEFCLREGSGRGECAPGCRDDDSCASGQVCNTETRVCGLPPCNSDADCPDEGTYCAEDGDCLEGCRLEPDNCQPNPENGRFTECDETQRTCVDVVVCCEANDTCSESTTGECSGQTLSALRHALRTHAEKPVLRTKTR